MYFLGLNRFRVVSGQTMIIWQFGNYWCNFITFFNEIQFRAIMNSLFRLCYYGLYCVKKKIVNLLENVVHLKCKRKCTTFLRAARMERCFLKKKILLSCIYIQCISAHSFAYMWDWCSFVTSIHLSYLQWIRCKRNMNMRCSGAAYRLNVSRFFFSCYSQWKCGKNGIIIIFFQVTCSMLSLLLEAKIEVKIVLWLPQPIRCIIYANGVHGSRKVLLQIKIALNMRR